jgi:hypothetical protein
MAERVLNKRAADDSVLERTASPVPLVGPAKYQWKGSVFIHPSCIGERWFASEAWQIVQIGFVSVPAAGATRRRFLSRN